MSSESGLNARPSTPTRRPSSDPPASSSASPTIRARRAHPELGYAGSVLGAAAEADVLLLLTDWPEFSQADPEVIGKAVARRNVADGRNALDAGAWRAAGWTYRALGRP